MINSGFDLYAFENGISQGGIPVYVKHLPWISGWLAIRILINVGATDDPEGKEGLAHFVEHMPFNGTERHPSFQDINNVEYSLFQNTLNAHTGAEYTFFEGNLLTENISDGMEVFRELIFHPHLDPYDTERERNVILQEIRKVVWNASIAEIHKIRLKDLYHNFPFSRFWQPAGWEETVNMICVEDLLTFHHTYYHTGNISVFFAGDITLDKGLRLVDDFAECAPYGSPRNRRQLIQETWPIPRIHSRSYSLRNLLRAEEEVERQVDMRIYRVIPKQENNRLPLLLGAVLKERLTEEIRGRLGAVYSISMNDLRYTSHELCSLGASIDPTQYKRVTEIFTEVLAALRDGAITHTSLFEKVKKGMMDRIRMRDPSVTDIVTTAVLDVVRNGAVVTSAEEYLQFEKVTLENIQQFARTEFAEEQLHWFILEP